MRALVVGGGLVGSTLAAKLSRDRHDVVVVEQDPERLREISEDLDVQTVAGNGTTVDVLRRAGIEDCEILFACTSSDEANMVVALIGSAIFRVPRVVARLREPDHEESFRAISQRIPGEHVCLNPDQATVEKVLSLLWVPGAVDVAPFFDGRLVIAGFPIERGSDLEGLLLSHLRLLFPTPPVLAVAVRRGERWFVPHGEDEFRADDLVYLAVDRSELSNVLELVGVRQAVEERVMISGASRVGMGLARRLEKGGTPVTLIEEDRVTAEQAAGVLEQTMVIHGTATDRALLEEEGIERVAAFVGCTEHHQMNVVAALLAQRAGAARCFAMVDDPTLAVLGGELGIDALISPRLLTVGLAVQFVRIGRVRAAAALTEDMIELVEAEVDRDSRLVRAPLAALGLPRGVLVAALMRGDRLIVPAGQDRIEPGDRVLLITTSETTGELDAFFGG